MYWYKNNQLYRWFLEKEILICNLQIWEFESMLYKAQQKPIKTEKFSQLFEKRQKAVK